MLLLELGTLSGGAITPNHYISGSFASHNKDLDYPKQTDIAIWDGMLTEFSTITIFALILINIVAKLEVIVI